MVAANPFAPTAAASTVNLLPSAGLGEHARALAQVVKWHNSKPRRQVFRLFGAAGTGKTTVARDIARAVGGNVLFAAFSGKAASVLRGKGCEGATTIHSLIYRPYTDAKGKLTFILNEDSPIRGARLLIIDECSMVDAKMGRDLESFGVPILVLGDKEQLPPVTGAGYFTNQPADIQLTQIHRQTGDDPIIQLAGLARSGKNIPKGVLGATKVISAKELDHQEVLDADQILAGTWSTVTYLNDRIREILGRPYGVPVAGDKLVCRKNNRGKGVLNGEIWFVKEITDIKSDKVFMVLSAELNDCEVSVCVDPACFTVKSKDDLDELSKRAKDRDVFTFGNVLTVHQAQGSEWDRVVLFDESKAFRHDRSKWVYTGITRAAKSLIIAQP
ncbi:ATP-dependent RecD-like DNA helicase [Tardiphaga sp. P9-11]|uniref:ATP-dependent DNA helicase n=1 Tax=Tardiphaga sp. P9-11 TaxID=2024614 RepID=UPI001FF0301F|nr:ATP-dependent RecD-like DNA helicase [Tardiphaga sp. P9-11]